MTTLKLAWDLKNNQALGEEMEGFQVGKGGSGWQRNHNK